MPSLEPPDNHFLDAATGWLMLGNAVESWREFEQIRPEARNHPAAVEFLWHYFAHEKRWLEAADVAGMLVAACPDEPSAWIHRSFALHELRRTQEAFDLLLPAAKRFPKETTVPYNLACYTCQLGDLPTARRWFQRVLTLAKSLAEKLHRLRAALDDADLEPLWPELRAHQDQLEADR
jgi:tetratricopeptide (TPR) repeat protein